MAKVSSLGISSFITQIAIVLVMAVTNNILVSYGAQSKYGAEIPLTTIGITMKVNQIVSAVLLGLATGAQPIWGYNYGSGQKDRVKQAYRIILTASTIMLVLAFFVFQLAPMSIVRLFGSESELYNEFAVKCFRIFLLACPINGAADGDRHFLPGNRKTDTGNRAVPVPPDCLSAPGHLVAAAGIRGGRGIVGRSAGRCACIYHNSDHVEIILEKDLRRHLWKEELSP